MATSHNDSLNSMVLKLWDFCITHQIELTATNLPGSSNIVAEKESRKIYREGEWMLKPLSSLSKSVLDLHQKLIYLPQG